MASAELKRRELKAKLNIVIDEAEKCCLSVCSLSLVWTIISTCFKETM